MDKEKQIEELTEEIADIESVIEELEIQYDGIDKCDRTPRWLEEACNIYWKIFEFDYATDELIIEDVRRKASE